jgi:multidrug efflux pump subunit AcrA (membrane-fusion protein)
LTPKPSTFFAGINRKTIRFVAVIFILAAVGGYTYYSRVFPATQNANESTAQTARVRRGDIIVSASGSGTLIAQTDASFGFETSGQVTDVYVKVGHQVEAGQVLAQLDDTLARMEYVEAQQALLELYSAASIATVQQEIGTAQDTEYYAHEWLEYLLSEEVVAAEENLAIAEQKLDEAQAEATSNPSDAAEQAVKQNEQAVTFLSEKLDQAWAYYENEYLPENFGEYENVGSRRHPKQVLVTYIDPYTGEERPEINGPSIADIAIARNNLAQAQETVRENEIYLEVLQTGVIPEGATGEKLSALYEAQLAVENAQTALEDRQLIAPIPGTVTALDLSIGEQVDKDAPSTSSATSATVTLFDLMSNEPDDNDTSSTITISQLSQPYTLDVYIDEADWSLAQVGNKVNVTFELLDGQTFPGTVTLVYPVLSESFEASLVHLIVRLDQRISQDLPAGTGAEVEVVGGEAKGVVLVPVDALHETEDGKHAVTVIQNGQQVEREVEIGLQNDTYAEVRSGLAAGEIVVTR